MKVVLSLVLCALGGAGLASAAPEFYGTVTGSINGHAIDVRVVCATHQDLKTQISEGRFREDLYYRLAEIVVNIPPLRSRNGEALELAERLQGGGHPNASGAALPRSIHSTQDAIAYLRQVLAPAPPDPAPPGNTAGLFETAGF